jgi:hypothetical protein
MGTVGRQSMHRTSAMAELFNVFRTRAAEYAWRPSPSPWPPSSPHGGEEGGNIGAGEKERWQPLTQWLHRYGTRPMRNLGF